MNLKNHSNRTFAIMSSHLSIRAKLMAGGTSSFHLHFRPTLRVIPLKGVPRECDDSSQELGELVSDL